MADNDTSLGGNPFSDPDDGAANNDPSSGNQSQGQATAPDKSILDEWLHPCQPFKDGRKLYCTVRIPPRPRNGGDIFSVEEVCPIEPLPPEVAEAFKAHTKKVDANDMESDELLTFNHWCWDNAPTIVRRQSNHKTLAEMMELYPNKREYVIEGILRVGEVANLVSGPKAKKTILAYNISMNVITGQKLFGIYKCAQGKVLYIDNELHPEEIVSRAKLVATSMGVPLEYAGQMIHFVHLRGNLVDLDNIDEYLNEFHPGQFKLIILDALYRLLPVRTDENDNGSMSRIYNKLDLIATKLDAPLLVIHHSTKGNQSGKSVTDVGAGAGVQSRAADAHIILRDHKEENCVVLEAAVRSSAPIKPLGLRFKWPKWSADPSLDVSQLAGTQGDDNHGGTGGSGGDGAGGGRKISRVRDALLGGIIGSQPKTLEMIQNTISAAPYHIQCGEKTLRDAVNSLKKEGRVVTTKVRGCKGEAFILNTGAAAQPSSQNEEPQQDNQDDQESVQQEAANTQSETENAPVETMPSLDEALPPDLPAQFDDNESDTPFDVD